jgi:hypothetical protein
MKKVEIKNYHDPETQKEIRAIFIDDNVFDWNIGPAEIEKARQACRNEESRRAIHANIQDHFLRCFAVFMGKKYALREVNESIEKGYIE